jgi:hypothetical protein
VATKQFNLIPVIAYFPDGTRIARLSTEPTISPVFSSINSRSATLRIGKTADFFNLRTLLPTCTKRPVIGTAWPNKASFVVLVDFDEMYFFWTPGQGLRAS